MTQPMNTNGAGTLAPAITLAQPVAELAAASAVSSPAVPLTAGDETTVPADPVPGEMARLEPSDKNMGVVKLTLDKGVTTTVIGHIYGLDFEIEGDGYRVRIFFDYYNRRLKVLEYEASDYRAMVNRMTWLAQANNFDKIFLKASKDDWQVFLTFGYVLEGIMRHYFRGDDAYILSKFRSVERISSPHLIQESDLIEDLMKGPRTTDLPPLPEGYTMELAREEHIPGLVTLYRKVFETYPSPLTHPDFIQQTMARNMLYRVILNGDGEVVSAASADIDSKHGNAELTDCATLSTERGKGLMVHLLRCLEDDLRERRIMTGYTLARAMSKGMNRVFYRLGYEFSGRLVNNCDIYGAFEDLNIWVKRLDRK